MNEQLQSKLVEILSSIQAAAKAGGDFALSQLPDIAQSYVMYGRAVATARTLLLLAALALCAFVALRHGYMGTALDKYEEGWAESRITAAVVGTVIGFVFFMIFLIQINSLLIVWFAPKVWLLKEIASLMT